MVRRILITLILVLLTSGAAGAWLWWHSVPRPKGEAYVGLGDVSLWDGNGQIRRRLQGLSYGEKLVILDQYNDSIEVRTPQGTIGWVNQSNLVSPDTWQQLGNLATRVRAMTVQARGHTNVLSNLHIEPGRTVPRVGQLLRNTPVEILSRGVAERAGNSAGGQSGRPRKEDWLLVRARAQEGAEMAGWVLGDFIADDLPNPLPAYVASSSMRPVAWFALRKVNDPVSGPKPYYLVMGTSGPKGQACDFTMLRVFTWSVAHEKYETSFVRNGLCGKLPVRVTLASNRPADARFGFQNLQPDATLNYFMHDTIVRALRPSGAAKAR